MSQSGENITTPTYPKIRYGPDRHPLWIIKGQGEITL